MFVQPLKYIAFLGINKNHLDNVSQIKITNTLSLMVVLVLTVQIPIIIVYWQFAGSIALVLNLCHIFALVLVMICNAKGFYQAARATLMLSFIGYISFSTIVWQVDLQFPSFILISLFVCPFLYHEWEKRQVLSHFLIYFLVFVYLQVYLEIRHADGFAALPASFVLSIISQCMLFLAACIASFLIFYNHQKSRKRLKHHCQALSNVLSKTLPSEQVKKLVLQFANESPQEGNVTRSQGSILFADIQNYTEYCQQSSHGDLTRMLNAFYLEFDKTIWRYGLQKLKTNGDQYIVVSGVLEKHDNHALQLCLGAKAFMQAFEKLTANLNINNLQLRIGIASGELLSGFAASNNFCFDVWGETVNLASRIENEGLAGSIEVCSETYQQCQSTLLFDGPKKRFYKGIGLRTYYTLSQYSRLRTLT